MRTTYKISSNSRRTNNSTKYETFVSPSIHVSGSGRHPRSRYEQRDDDSRVVGRHRRGEGGAPSAAWGHRGGRGGRAARRPFFDDSASSGNITLIEGQTAMMECVVKHVGNKSVSQSAGRRRGGSRKTSIPDENRSFIGLGYFRPSSLRSFGWKQGVSISALVLGLRAGVALLTDTIPLHELHVRS